MNNDFCGNKECKCFEEKSIGFGQNNCIFFTDINNCEEHKDFAGNSVVNSESEQLEFEF